MRSMWEDRDFNIIEIQAFKALLNHMLGNRKLDISESGDDLYDK